MGKSNFWNEHCWAKTCYALLCWSMFLNIGQASMLRICTVDIYKASYSYQLRKINNSNVLLLHIVHCKRTAQCMSGPSTLKSSQSISDFNRPNNNAETENKNYFHFCLRPFSNANNAKRWLWKSQSVFAWFAQVMTSYQQLLLVWSQALLPSVFVVRILSS